MEDKIKIREANSSDIDFLFELRNRPETYEICRVNRPVEKEAHINWITPILNKEKRDIYLYTILYDGERSGQVRFDLKNQTIAEVSISLLKEYWGGEIAEEGMRLGFMEMEKKGIEKIIAEIKKTNLRSISFFQKQGFYKIDEKEGWEKFEYNLK